MLKVIGRGAIPSRIMLVGEAPGFDDEIAGEPFVGMAGRELKAQLKEVGIKFEDCYVTHVCKYRPPGNDIDEWITSKKTIAKKNGWLPFGKDRYAHPLVYEGIKELIEELELVQPDIVIGFGNVALWALYGEWGIGNWRGSELTIDTEKMRERLPK